MRVVGEYYDGLDDTTRVTVDQVTLRKMEFAQALLKNRALPWSGTRSTLRERLAKALSEGLLELVDLQVLVEELEMWGDQRIRIARLPQVSLASLTNPNQLGVLMGDNGFADLLGAPHRVSESSVLELLWVEYLEQPARVRIVAGKVREIETRLKDVPERVDPDLPHIVFVPFKREFQNALTFAEVTLATGDTLLSTTKLPLGYSYKVEYDEFRNLILPLIDMSLAISTDLRVAVSKINQGLPEAKRHAIKRKTAQNTVLNMFAPNRLFDMGGDIDANQLLIASQNHEDAFANCTWVKQAQLEREVHIHVFAPTGEVTVLHQVQEFEVRHVLSRILQLN